MAEIIHIASNQVLLHSYDLLDQRVIQNGCFMPNYTQESVEKGINEIVKLVRLQLTEKTLKIKVDVS